MDLSQIATDLDTARLYYLQKAGEVFTKLKTGCGSVKDLTPLKRLINGLQFQIDYQVDDSTTQSLYSCMMAIISGFTGSYTPDPTVIIPGQTVTIIVEGSVVNSERIPFTNATIVSLANYQANYYPTYGNLSEYSIWVSDGADGFNQDNGNVPNISFVVPGVITSGIASITWGYPVATTGYVQISGVQPTT